MIPRDIPVYVGIQGRITDCAIPVNGFLPITRKEARALFGEIPDGIVRLFGRMTLLATQKQINELTKTKNYKEWLSYVQQERTKEYNQNRERYVKRRNKTKKVSGSV